MFKVQVLMMDGVWKDLHKTAEYVDGKWTFPTYETEDAATDAMVEAYPDRDQYGSCTRVVNCDTGQSVSLNYAASIEATVHTALLTGDRDLVNMIENAAENGSIDWHNKPGDRSEKLEEAQALSYVYGYLQSIDRNDLYVEVKL